MHTVDKLIIILIFIVFALAVPFLVITLSNG